ncbi:MAG: ATP-binding protein [Bacteroidetes bacterium]|nr:MAG: ATP-binding protein [Bacteroidota bacterium]
MTTASKNLPKRYPGLNPFTRDQSAVFYGRGEDVQRLTNLVLRERLVVLFAKSGIGKTSLLQAGVAPELEKNGFTPLFLRADNTHAQLVNTIGSALEKDPNVGGRDTTDELKGDRETLWERMKRLQFDMDGLPATPVLVFDQFEEVFTLGHNETSRRRFLNELADLANASMPETIRALLMERLENKDPKLTATIMQWWEQQPDYRIVLSIRSDFLHLLDEISPLIPNILRNRYQLQPLNRRQAQSAIEEPARSPGQYASPVFGYAESAIREMLDFLAGEEAREEAQEGDASLAPRKQDEIESFNLQILCQHVENQVIAGGQPAGFAVTPDFYGGLDGLEHEIRNFYQKQLQGLPDVFARRTDREVEDPAAFIHTAQRLIEESLVTPIGRRCSMVDDFLTATWGVDHDFLDTLVETRLLRKELRLDDYYYEISHDTLLPPILESRDARRRQEKADQEKQELQERLAEEARQKEAMAAELQAMQERRRLARRVALFSLTTLILMIGFGIWFSYNWIQSLRKELEQAEFVVSGEAFHAGLEAYENLRDKGFKRAVLEKVSGKDIQQELEKVHRMHSVFDTVVTANMVRGDSLFFRDRFSEALTDYREAYEMMNTYTAMNDYVRIKDNRDTIWRINRKNIRQRYEDLYQRREFALNAIIAQFRIKQRAAEEFSDAGVWGQALRIFREMEALLPTHQVDLQRLQEAMHLNQPPREYVEQEINRCQAGLRF